MKFSRYVLSRDRLGVEHVVTVYVRRRCVTPALRGQR